MIWSEARGDGEQTIVLSHGWGATAHMWEPQLDELATRARVVTWDLRGHGRSPSPDDPSAYSLAVAVADLEALVDERKVVLVGHSFGGQLSMAFTMHRPDLVEGLGLLSTGPGYRNAEAMAGWNEGIERQARALEKQGMDALPAGEEMHGGLHTSARALAHAIRGFVTQRDSRIIEGLTSIDVPSLVLVGAKDRGFLNGADYLAAKIPQAVKVVVPDAGHAVNRHQPHVVNEALWLLLDAAAAWSHSGA